MARAVGQSDEVRAANITFELLYADPHRQLVGRAGKKIDGVISGIGRFDADHFLPAFGSHVPEAGAVTVTVRVTLAPLARFVTVGHVTTPPASEPPLLAETKVTSGGSSS